MRCSQCNSENLSDAAFCAECGSNIELTCPSCSVTNPLGSKFCRKCGTALAASGVAAAKKSNDSQIRIAEFSVSKNLDGESKTVTALFADIKGSMELIEDLDPEDARAVVDQR